MYYFRVRTLGDFSLGKAGTQQSYVTHLELSVQPEVRECFTLLKQSRN